MLRRLFRVFWYTAAALVVTTAVLASAARFLFPVVSGYRADVEAWVSQRVGEPVRIGSLRATWWGLEPVIRLGDVRVLDHQTGQVLLAARELRISLDLWASLRAHHPMPGGVTVVGTRLDLMRLANGRIVLRGFEDRPVQDLPLALLLQQQQAAIMGSSISWTDLGKAGRSLRFNDVNIRLRNRGDEHRLDGEAVLPSTLGRTVEFSAQLTGSLRGPRHWQGAVYVHGQGLRVGAWSVGHAPAGLSLAGAADLSLWAGIKDSRLNTLSGIAATRDLEVAGQAPAAGDRVRFSSLDGRFRWTRAADGWRLDVDRLQVRADGTDWPQTTFSLAVSAPDGGHGQEWRVRAGYADIGIVRRLAGASDLLTDKQHRALAELAPVGRVRGLQLALLESGGTVQHLGFRLGFDGLGVHHWDKYPAVAGLSGTAHGDLKSGEVVLQSAGTSFDAPHLFAAPIGADRLSGTVSWHRYGDRLRVQSERLDIGNRDLQARARARLDFPSDGSSPVLDMEVAFGKGNVAHVARYLPEGIMPAPAVRWLHRALISGRVSDGAMLFHGRLADFPFRDNQGVFQVSFNVRDAVLDYLIGWPRIEQLAGHVDFVGGSMQVHADSAKVLGNDLQDVQAGVADLRHPRLTVTGTANGPLSDMLGFLRASPLSHRYTGMLGQVQATGTASVDLSLDVPLHGRNSPVTVKGSVRLSDNGLTFGDWHVGLKKLQGTLNFAGDELTADDLRARFLDRPVRISVATEHPARQPPSTRVELVGQLNLMDQLRKTDAGRPLAKRITGAAQWQLLMTVPRPADAGSATSATLTLESDLKGVAVSLPSPLAKAASEARTLVLQTTVSGSHATPVSVSYGNVLRARLALAVDQGRLQLRRGEVRFGTAPARLPAAPGLTVTGEIPQLSVAQWMDGVDPLLGAGAAEAGAMVREVDLRVGRLNAFGQHFGDTRVQVRRAAAAWLVELSGARIDGRIDWPLHPSRENRVQLTLRHLALESGTVGGARPDTGMNPARIPPLKVTAKRLDYGGVDLGRLELKTVPEPSGLKVERTDLISDWLQLHTQGDWQERDGRQTSRFQITVTGGDLGKMLTAFGYAGNIKGGQTRGDVSANWLGSPMAFSLQRLQGHLQLHIGEGRILRVEPGAGRVFGLLSLQALPRRLSLDFSDLFRKGFSFDSIEGNFTLNEGDAYTSDLTVDGPSARIEIAGRTGLVARDYDQLITVIPRIRSSLPLAGAIAGGPAVGAALFLMDKLLPGPMTELTSLANYQYTLTGSWDNPIVKRLGKDSAGSRSSPSK
ncbi:MAG: YhdP family protein [Gammaproteobacteria bacterium]